MDKDSGLIHSVETTGGNVHDLTPAEQLLHGEEEVVYSDTGYQGIGKRPEMEGKSMTFRVAIRPGKRRALPDTEGRLLALVETAKALIGAKGGTSLPGNEVAILISEDQAERHGKKSL